MRKLFEPSEINGMKLQNRFVRSATWEGRAEQGGHQQDMRVKAGSHVIGHERLLDSPGSSTGNVRGRGMLTDLRIAENRGCISLFEYKHRRHVVGLCRGGHGQQSLFDPTDPTKNYPTEEAFLLDKAEANG